MKVLLTSVNMINFLPRLKETLSFECEFIVPETGSEEELIFLAKDVDVIICVRLDEDVVKAAEKLKLIQKTGAGVDEIPFNAFKDRKIFVSNTSGSNSVPVAEHAFALILALSKKIISRHNKFQKGIVEPEVSIQLMGKTLGILGLGNIGMEVAKRASAFGMKVIAIKRFLEDRSATKIALDFLGGPKDLEYILKSSDFVVITLPLTPETKGIIGEKEFKIMKKTSFLINVARGEIVQEESLYTALKEGWIAGAGLDVWSPSHWWDPKWSSKETRSPKFLIHQLENVVATPHVAGSTDTPSSKSLDIIAENISRIFRGDEPINQVNRILQY